jgi:hypothetical protein
MRTFRVIALSKSLGRHGRCSNEKGGRLRARPHMANKRKLRLCRRNDSDADRLAARYRDSFQRASARRVRELI